jgi:hypothetical protein
VLVLPSPVVRAESLNSARGENPPGWDLLSHCVVCPVLNVLRRGETTMAFTMFLLLLPMLTRREQFRSERIGESVTEMSLPVQQHLTRLDGRRSTVDGQPRAKGARFGAA